MAEEVLEIVEVEEVADVVVVHRKEEVDHQVQVVLPKGQGLISHHHNLQMVMQPSHQGSYFLLISSEKISNLVKI